MSILAQKWPIFTHFRVKKPVFLLFLVKFTEAKNMNFQNDPKKAEKGPIFGPLIQKYTQSRVSFFKKLFLFFSKLRTSKKSLKFIFQ